MDSVVRVLNNKQAETQTDRIYIIILEVRLSKTSGSFSMALFLLIPMANGIGVLEEKTVMGEEYVSLIIGQYRVPTDFRRKKYRIIGQFFVGISVSHVAIKFLII